MNLDDIKDIKSDFLGEVFLGEKKNEAAKKKERKRRTDVKEEDLL